MYLSRLEILGFKSFAQRTVVNFNQGVTSIVGPNGCGKTNIVDAIRWCLGEQRSGALRSDKMENVIFNGTSNKKPMGMAEVSLTIENTKGILPTEFSEVTITRRIFRSGESEYLLNKNICRLKDITNLFMDTGIGANAYSVIELKMVETILSSKADERRVLFEEAAGVNKYKLRRRLALKKLDEVKSDLVRVNDIVNEVQKKVNSLERQAKKAEKYNSVSTSLRQIEIDLAEREFSLFNAQKESAKINKNENSETKIKLESQLAGLDEKIKIIKNNLKEVEFDLKSKRSEVASQTEKIYNTQKNISVSEERIKSLDANIERYNQELDELKIQLETAKKLINEGGENIKDFDERLSKKKREQNENETKVGNFKITLDEKRNNLKAHSEQILIKFKQITNSESEFSNLQKSFESKNLEINKLKGKIENLSSTIAKTVGFIEELNREKNETESNLKEAEIFVSQKQQEKEKLENTLNQLKEKELEDRTYLNSIKEKINFIQSLINNLEGVTKGAKALIEEDSWASKEKTLLLHIGNSPEKYRSAVEASLKNNLNNILLESFDDLKKGIEYLKNNEIGKASFYVTEFNNSGKKTFLDKISDYNKNKKIKKLQKEPEFLGWAKDFIETDKKWKSFFEKLLRNTAVVNSIESVFKLFNEYPDFNFAALNGDYIDSNGIIEAGSAPKIDDSLFGRKQFLENLKSEFPQKEKNLFSLKNEIEQTEEKINGIDLKVLSERSRMLQNDIANIEKQIAQFEFENKKAKDECEKTRKEIQELALESNKIDNEKNELEDALKSKKEEKSKADEKLNELESEFNKIEDEYNGIISDQNKINLDLERLQGEKKNIENSIEHSQNSIERIEQSISKREFDISSALKEKKSLKELIDKNILELKNLNEHKEILLKEENEIDEKYKLLQNQISETESEQQVLRKNKEDLSDLIHASDMQLNELGIKISNLTENINENYSLRLQLKAFDDLEGFDFKTRSEEVHSLKQQVKNLGPINLLAYTEFDEEKERLDFLLKQRNDLLESEKDITKTISEINTTAQTKFMETFEKIRGHFVDIFRGLFNPGDEADLRIEENADPLEAKIEIIAKPKGKRPTSIELLSGGEKTLTAIALLFAIYLVKPSPFCILDEIDAPLDDANIDRFTKIIEDFSRETQFIVVTHNKRTMEAANTLYGVTMQDEGISKLVSVRFNEDMSFAS